MKMEELLHGLTAASAILVQQPTQLVYRPGLGQYVAALCQESR